MEKKKILVVDDEFPVANLIKINLEDAGYQVEIALDGKMAMERIENNPPDLITLDLLMPKMNGFQLLKTLKSNNQYRKIPVIIVSIVSGAEKKKGFHLGAIDFVEKPINFEYLFKLLEKIKNLSTSSDFKIMLVDVTKDSLSRLKNFLEEKGIPSMVTASGEKLPDQIRKEKPSIILLELHPPEGNGLETIRQLKKEKDTENIPIIVISSLELEKYRQQCLFLGVNQYLTHPISEEMLMREIKKYLIDLNSRVKAYLNKNNFKEGGL